MKKFSSSQKRQTNIFGEVLVRHERGEPTAARMGVWLGLDDVFFC